MKQPAALHPETVACGFGSCRWRAFECAGEGFDRVALSVSPADCRKCSGIQVRWLRKRPNTR